MKKLCHELFFSGNMQDRTVVSMYIVGHIQYLRLPKKSQISYFSVKYGIFYEKWFIFQRTSHFTCQIIYIDVLFYILYYSITFG